MADFLRGWGRGIAILGIATTAFGAEAPTLLRELARPAEATRVRIALKAEGQYQPAPPPGASAKAEKPKPLSLKVETRLDFAERVVKVDEDGRASRAVRRVVQAASAINGEIRPTGAVLRPEVTLLVAEPRGKGVFVFSPGGPLTRGELELVQGPGDPLTLAALLPLKRVTKGSTWRVGDEAARALSAYDALAVNLLEATLESIDDASAKVRLSGEIRGAALGGEGSMTCKGTFTFDRKAGRVSALTLDRQEVRKPGPVEAGLDMKSTLTVTRDPVAVPDALGDKALAGVAADPDPRLELLVLIPPNGKYSVRHDRDWHTYWDDSRQTVLKRLDQGVVVAQCNLALGPNAGKGRHQDLEQFRSDLRRALGRRFSEFVGVGEVDGDPAGGFRYKVGARGREGELAVIWDYYLVASPEGDQLLATFTLTDDQAKAFGDQDLRVIGSLRWKDAGATPSKP